MRREREKDKYRICIPSPLELQTTTQFWCCYLIQVVNGERGDVACRFELEHLAEKVQLRLQSVLNVGRLAKPMLLPFVELQGAGQAFFFQSSVHGDGLVGRHYFVLVTLLE